MCERDRRIHTNTDTETNKYGNRERGKGVTFLLGFWLSYTILLIFLAARTAEILSETPMSK